MDIRLIESENLFENMKSINQMDLILNNKFKIAL